MERKLEGMRKQENECWIKKRWNMRKTEKFERHQRVGGKRMSEREAWKNWDKEYMRKKLNVF